MSPKEEIVIYKKPKMTKGQVRLYTVLLKKIKTNDPITFEEAKEIYIGWGCREVRGGVPHSYNPWWKDNNGVERGRWEPLNEWEVATRTMLWLTSNIGALVLKGYLKVIPQIELKELKSII